MSKNDFDLAFENQLPAGALPELWRVVSMRPISGRLPMRHTEYFATEDCALEHAARINDGRGKILSISRYVLESKP